MNRALKFFGLCLASLPFGLFGCKEAAIDLARLPLPEGTIALISPNAPDISVYARAFYEVGKSGQMTGTSLIAQANQAVDRAMKAVEPLVAGSPDSSILDAIKISMADAESRSTSLNLDERIENIEDLSSSIEKINQANAGFQNISLGLLELLRERLIYELRATECLILKPLPEEATLLGSGLASIKQARLTKPGLQDVIVDLQTEQQFLLHAPCRNLTQGRALNISESVMRVEKLTNRLNKIVKGEVRADVVKGLQQVEKSIKATKGISGYLDVWGKAYGPVVLDVENDPVLRNLPAPSLGDVPSSVSPNHFDIVKTYVESGSRNPLLLGGLPLSLDVRVWAEQMALDQKASEVFWVDLALPVRKASAARFSPKQLVDWIALNIDGRIKEVGSKVVVFLVNVPSLNYQQPGAPTGDSQENIRLNLQNLLAQMNVPTIAFMTPEVSFLMKAGTLPSADKAKAEPYTYNELDPVVAYVVREKNLARAPGNTKPYSDAVAMVLVKVLRGFTPDKLFVSTLDSAINNWIGGISKNWTTSGSPVDKDEQEILGLNEITSQTGIQREQMKLSGILNDSGTLVDENVAKGNTYLRVLYQGPPGVGGGMSSEQLALLRASQKHLNDLAVQLKKQQDLASRKISAIIEKSDLQREADRKSLETTAQALSELKTQFEKTKEDIGKKLDARDLDVTNLNQRVDAQIEQVNTLQATIAQSLSAEKLAREQLARDVDANQRRFEHESTIKIGELKESLIKNRLDAIKDLQDLIKEQGELRDAQDRLSERMASDRREQEKATESLRNETEQRFKDEQAARAKLAEKQGNLEERQNDLEGAIERKRKEIEAKQAALGLDLQKQRENQNRFAQEVKKEFFDTGIKDVAEKIKIYEKIREERKILEQKLAAQQTQMGEAQKIESEKINERITSLSKGATNIVAEIYKDLTAKLENEVRPLSEKIEQENAKLSKLKTQIENNISQLTNIVSGHDKNLEEQKTQQEGLSQLIQTQKDILKEQDKALGKLDALFRETRKRVDTLQEIGQELKDKQDETMAAYEKKLKAKYNIEKLEFRALQRKELTMAAEDATETYQQEFAIIKNDSTKLQENLILNLNDIQKLRERAKEAIEKAKHWYGGTSLSPEVQKILEELVSGSETSKKK